MFCFKSDSKLLEKSLFEKFARNEKKRSKKQKTEQKSKSRCLMSVNLIDAGFRSLCSLAQHFCLQRSVAFLELVCFVIFLAKTTNDSHVCCCICNCVARVESRCIGAMWRLGEWKCNCACTNTVWLFGCDRMQNNPVRRNKTRKKKKKKKKKLTSSRNNPVKRLML
jgi:hypothetical protein